MLLAADFEWFREGWLVRATDVMYLWIVVPLLVFAGIYFSLRTGFVQFRRFGAGAKLSLGSKDYAIDDPQDDSDEGISGFGAFCVGLAARTGTGNIAGIAVALVLGGPGAIFWMWIVAALSMASSVIENTLGQIYKEPVADGSFRGGPAFYIERGLKSKGWSKAFGVLFILTVGVAFIMVQANTITDAISGAVKVDARTVAVPMALLTAWIIFRGVKGVANILEAVTPWVAGGYIAFGLTVVFLNVNEVPHMMNVIMQSAFGVGPAAAGISGAFLAAVMNGARRGLFSNEAGQGQAPNTAGSATTPHPVDQGHVQSFGVFICTFVICSLSAFVVLLAAGDAYQPGTKGGLNGAQLVSAAAGNQFGSAGEVFIVIALFLFGYTTIIGNYSLTEGNVTNILGFGPTGVTVFRWIVIAAILIGSVLALDTVWAIGDVFMAALTLINLVAIIKLFPVARVAIRDWDRQRSAGERPIFVADTLPTQIPGDVWAIAGGQNTLQQPDDDQQPTPYVVS